MARERLTFRVHAIQRMFERQISQDDVRHVLATGDVIDSYPEDSPYLSRLVLGWTGSRPLHVVVAFTREASEQVVITVYEPNSTQWDREFRRRRL